MTIPFDNIPADLRIPFVTAEFDNTQADQGPALQSYRHLIIGQKLTAGSAVADSLHKVTSAEHVIALAGRGSMLHRQALRHFQINKATETWIGVLADNGAGVAASGTITVTVTTAKKGTIPLYVGGKLIPVGVAAGDAQNDIATAIGAAINADADLPVTASVATNVVTVSFRHKGEVGNGYDLRDSFNAGEALPEGVSLALVVLASGATNPSLTNLIAALGDTWYHIWTNPYLDATSLTAIETELADRFGPMRMIDGVAIAGVDDTHSNLTTLGDGRNSPHASIVAQPGYKGLTPAFEHGAAMAARASKTLPQDPARGMHTLEVTGSISPDTTNQFSNEERNLLLKDGIATTKATPDGKVQIGRLITTYQTNSAGAADKSYLDVTTMMTLMYFRYSWRNRMMTKYPRHKLADDGTRVGAGQAVFTPADGKLEAIGWFRQMEALGLVENFDEFKENLQCVRNVGDPNRLDWLLPPNLINKLIVQATKIQPRL